MRRARWLALVGLLVFVLAALATLPASLLVSRLPPDVVAEGVGGSVWRGSAERVLVRGAPVGWLSWDVRPLALLRGRLEYDVNLVRSDGFLRGRLAAAFGGALYAHDVSLAMPITALNPQPSATAWHGDLEGTVREARLENGWPTRVLGDFRIGALRPPGVPFEIGSYGLEFDDAATTPTTLVGRVRDLEAPVTVRAQLAMQREGSYRLEGEVTPKPGAPPEIANAIAFLGPADAQGRRGFLITGTF